MENKELIYREDLIAEYDRVHVGEPGGARKLMVDAPAVDVVEVVRCKDCKHYKVGNPNADYCYHKRYEELSQSSSYKPDDFCSYGERKCQSDT